MRQLTLAAATWGSALFACPPSSRVATQVVRRTALNQAEPAASRRMAVVSPVSPIMRIRAAMVSGRRRGRAGEVGAGDLVEPHRKFVGPHPRQGGAETVDRVVLHRQGAVAAGIPDLEPQVHVHLLARLHVSGIHLAIAHHRIAAVAVDDVVRLDQRPPVGEQPLHAVVVAALLVGGERQDHVAIQLHLFALEPDHGLDVDRGHVLDVARPTAVEVAVLLRQSERIE